MLHIREHNSINQNDLCEFRTDEMTAQMTGEIPVQLPGYLKIGCQPTLPMREGVGSRPIPCGDKASPPGEPDLIGAT